MKSFQSILFFWILFNLVGIQRKCLKLCWLQVLDVLMGNLLHCLLFRIIHRRCLLLIVLCGIRGIRMPSGDILRLRDVFHYRSKERGNLWYNNFHFVVKNDLGSKGLDGTKLIKHELKFLLAEVIIIAVQLNYFD